MFGEMIYTILSRIRGGIKNCFFLLSVKGGGVKPVNKKVWATFDMFCAYLIFVISFTQAKFLENRIYTEKRVNYDERISRQNSVNQDLLGQATKKVCKPTY